MREKKTKPDFYFHKLNLLKILLNLSMKVLFKVILGVHVSVVLKAPCTNVCFSPSVSSGGCNTVRGSCAEISVDETIRADVVLLLKCKMMQNDYLMAHDFHSKLRQEVN